MIGWLVLIVWAVVGLLMWVPCARAIYRKDQRDNGSVTSRQESAVFGAFFGFFVSAFWPASLAIGIVAGKLLGEDQEVHHREQ